MIKALKVVMIVYAVIGILFGLAYIFVPRQLGAMFGFEEGPAHGAATPQANSDHTQCRPYC